MAQALPIALAVVPALISGAGTIIGSKAEAKQLNAEADQLDVKAGTERATAQRQAMEQRRQGRLLASRALAVAAASGGGADDPTVANLMANIEGESEYRSLTALYNGEEEARGLEADAEARRKEARNVKKAGLLKTVGTIIGAAGSAYGAATSMKAKYG